MILRTSSRVENVVLTLQKIILVAIPNTLYMFSNFIGNSDFLTFAVSFYNHIAFERQFENVKIKLDQVFFNSLNLLLGSSIS